MDAILKYKKPLLFIAAALVLVEVIWGVYTLTRPIPSSSNQVTSEAKPEELKAIATLKGPTSVAVGETVKVEIELTSTSPAQGADLIIKYDPKVLELVKVKEDASTVGKTFQDYPANSADANGVISISGVTPGAGFSGTGVFATLNFKALNKGKTNITFDYKKDSTTDSNVTESSSGNDILGRVNNLEVSVN